ncbi:MAG: DUF6305 family protein [Synergistaceae bacterium]|jgi:hypothetical protein|nr:DUF6305 family protein [Synergistaceae bacterium]
MRRKRIGVMLAAMLGMMLSFAAVSAAIAELPKVAAPIVATTCGQSPGGMMVKMSAMQVKLSVTDKKDLRASEIAGKEYKTLIVTTGTSMKGMGAAGTDVDKEIARCAELIQAAKAEGILVIVAHIEGMARRTDASDEASIKAVMPLADFILIIEDSDQDGFFTNYAKELGKELVIVKDALGVGAKLAEMQ